MEKGSLVDMAMNKKYSSMVESIKTVRDAEIRKQIDSKKAALTASMKPA